jgi:CubicO group peptidase (beta-lactamase class C family)
MIAMRRCGMPVGELMRVDQFARLYLFKPLEIENARWNFFNNDEKVDTGGHLSLTTRDVCKIGQLIVNNGKWGNNQLISKKLNQGRNFRADSKYIRE